jgi:hypothetical protein
MPRSIEQTIEQMLCERGLSRDQSGVVIARLKSRDFQEGLDWGIDPNQYAFPIINLLWPEACREALAYIDETCPQMFYRAVFAALVAHFYPTVSIPVLPMAHKRLSPDMEDWSTVARAMSKNADGAYIPGACVVCQDLIERVDPVPKLGLFYLFFLDCLEVYGSDIWNLYDGLCEQSLSRLLDKLRSYTVRAEQGVAYDALSRELKAEIEATQTLEARRARSVGRAHKSRA